MDAVAARAFDDAYERVQARAALAVERRFEDLVDRHERRLRRAIFGMLADPNRVEDVLQEALYRAFRSLPARFENEHFESAWLYRIVHRCCLNELRSRRRRHELPGLPETAVFGSRDDAVESMAIAAALAELPPRARAVLLLVDVVGLDYETVARALDIPRGTVASRLRTARERFRNAIDA